MERTGRWLALIAAVCLIFVSWGSVQAQTPDSEYFAETGHYIRGDFLRFYRNTPNPTVVIGYPITEQFTSVDGKTVQYFQRARFEVGPTGEVMLTSLGREMYSPERQLVINYPFACRTFSTGYSVCFAFLEYFLQNGGVERFGNPISPFEFRNKQIVQYFENARFEWRPDLPEGQRVGLTDLGRMYFEQLGEDQAFLKPSQQGLSGPNNEVLELQVRAFPKQAVATSNDEQTIYVLVQDQNLQPVSRAQGVATIRPAVGETLQQSFETNSSGLSVLSFQFTNQPSGQLVSVDISISYNGLTGKTTTSFRIWY